MKIAELTKDVVIPLISVITATMVVILNYQVSTNDQQLRERDQEFTARLGEIDLFVKKQREERDERESNQEFNLKIYEIVTKSLEESNAQKQEAAKAFVVVMVNEPLRSSLLSVLRQGAEPEVKKDIEQILAAEEEFKRSVSITPAKRTEAAASYNWADWDFDVFWCSSSGAMEQAQLIGDQLVAEGAKGRIRVRELPDSINARPGYQISGYQIRHNDSERKVAAALKSLADNTLGQANLNSDFNLALSIQSTPWYVSAFVCPSS